MGSTFSTMAPPPAERSGWGRASAPQQAVSARVRVSTRAAMVRGVEVVCNSGRGKACRERQEELGRKREGSEVCRDKGHNAFGCQRWDLKAVRAKRGSGPGTGLCGGGSCKEAVILRRSCMVRHAIELVAKSHSGPGAGMCAQTSETNGCRSSGGDAAATHQQGRQRQRRRRRHIGRPPRCVNRHHGHRVVVCQRWASSAPFVATPTILECIVAAAGVACVDMSCMSDIVNQGSSSSSSRGQGITRSPAAWHGTAAGDAVHLLI